MRHLRRLACLSVVAALSVTLAACGDSESGTQNTEPEGETIEVTESSDADSQADAGEDEEAVYLRASAGDGIVNAFIGEKFYDGTVTDEKEAEDCIMSVLDRIGGDETTELEINSVRPNADGTKVVTFSQRAGGVLVYGATVKLVVDKDDVPIALISSIMPDVRIRPIEEWAISDKQAEQIVMDALAEQESQDTLVEGATERAIIGSTTESEHYICVWIVYTLQTENDDEAHQAYAAHYVSADGEYLYSLPVSEPGDDDARSGMNAATAFDFKAYEPDEMKVTLTHHDGETDEVSIPVLKDLATGKTYLADAKRKIVCADYGSLMYNDDLQVTEVQDGYDQNDVFAYYTFCRVWDYFDGIGWTGPDGDGTPSLLLMNYADLNGNPVDNAVFITKANGFCMFSFTRATNYGECVDVIGHEFTHCITGETMTANLYKNDQGAINEAMSDVLGNIVEMRLDGDAGAWTIGESRGEDGILRNMSNPHEHGQPEFAFDTYYAPRPETVSDTNDRGGVHVNSSLLNIVSYRLHEAGMPIRDQGYYWLNVALVLSPQTDYPMLAEILPWVMENLGYTEYVEPLKAAIEEAHFTDTEATDEIADGCGVATLDFAPIEEAANNGQVALVFLKAPEADLLKRANTWPAAGTTVARAMLPVGDYYVVVRIADPSSTFKRFMVLSEDGWKAVEGRDSATFKENGTTVSIKEGETLEIENDTFGPVATAQLEEIEQELQD